MAPYYKIIIPTFFILSVVSACGDIYPEIPSVTPIDVLAPPSIVESPYDKEGRKLEYEEIGPVEGSKEGELYDIQKWDTDEWDWHEEHSVSSSPVPSSNTMSKVCFYISLRNVNCRASDFVESSLIAILMQGEEAKLLSLNPTFTHGRFELSSLQQCWIALGLLQGPSDPYKMCQVSVVDAPPAINSSDLGGSDSPVCSSGLDEVSCVAAGGTWVSGATGANCDC